MTSDDIRQRLCAVLSAIQSDSGLAAPALSDSTRPLTDLPGFDSLAAVDAEVRLSEALGVDLEHIPFKSDTTGNQLTIAEIVAHLVEKYGPGIAIASKNQADAEEKSP